jgi:hypothetical protein
MIRERDGCKGEAPTKLRYARATAEAGSHGGSPSQKSRKVTYAISGAIRQKHQDTPGRVDHPAQVR